MVLRVATCQFPVDADISRNTRYVLRQLGIAKQRGAQIAHFPECGLSGYAGSEFETYEDFDWPLLRSGMELVLERARELKLWVILGSSHKLTGSHKPHNSSYVISAAGKVIDRYDKRFCSGDRAKKSGDLAHYSPGQHLCVFEVGGVRCGTLICYEYRFPELYREYKRRGVQLIFHSYHAGHLTPRSLKSMQEQVGVRVRRLNPGSTLPEITMPAAMHVAAANNYVWISCSNTSARESCWPSFFVRPDGVITGRLRRNTAGVLVSAVNTKRQYYDSTLAWRQRAMGGIFHSGNLVRDSRSSDRKCW
ncbi:MAG TPA: carbon-nitrogen hydrolase family protein [Polyangiaceae bacterium]|nr:carbon-nitrogen hydrolase family protein [Polyangiaceae bacterium]